MPSVLQSWQAHQCIVPGRSFIEWAPLVHPPDTYATASDMQACQLSSFIQHFAGADAVFSLGEHDGGRAVHSDDD